MYYNLFYREILTQIDFAFIAIKDIDKELSSFNSNMNKFWYSIQAFLVSTANISKILYPSPNSKETNKMRAEELRNALGLPEESILTDKRIRNSFEHFDEKLDKFLSSNNGVFVDQNIGAINAIKTSSTDATSYLRHYDPDEHIIIFQDLSYDIKEVGKELINLKQKIEKII